MPGVVLKTSNLHVGNSHVDETSTKKRDLECALNWCVLRKSVIHIILMRSHEGGVVIR